MKRLLPLAAGIVIAAALFGCTQKCKIEPPPGVVGTNKEMSAKAAANALSSAISGGELSGHYQNTVNNTYQTVGQDDVAFYLLLKPYIWKRAGGTQLVLQRFFSLPGKSLAGGPTTPQP